MKAAIAILFLMANAQGAAASSLLGDDAANASIDAFLTSYNKSATPAEVKPAPVENKPAPVVAVKPTAVVPVNIPVAVTQDPVPVAPVIPLPQPNPCRDPKSTLIVCVELRKKAQDAANQAADAADRKKAAADLLIKRAEAEQRLRSYKQCSKKESTNKYSDLKTMSQDILGLDVTSKSLVEEATRAGKGQFWLQNAGGSAQIRMKSDFGKYPMVLDLPAPVQACLINANTVQLKGCAHYFGDTCFTLTLSRKDSKRIQIVATGDATVNVTSDIATDAEIAR